jgi:hypothetical protein
MPKIRIIDIPPGQAPEHIRRAWVGLEMETTGQAPGNVILRGVIDGKPDSNPPNAGGYCVKTAEALRVLNVAHPDKAAWWQAALGRFPPSTLVFKREVCLLIP